MTTEAFRFKGENSVEPLVVEKTAMSRAQILEGLSDKERMLVCAIVETLERAPASLEGPELLVVTEPLLRAFRDATGVDYCGCEWDS